MDPYTSKFLLFIWCRILEKHKGTLVHIEHKKVMKTKIFNGWVNHDKNMSFQLSYIV